MGNRTVGEAKEVSLEHYKDRTHIQMHVQGALSDQSTITNVVQTFLADQLYVLLGLKEISAGHAPTHLQFNLLKSLLYGRQDWQVTVEYLRR